ncbi:DNA repair protein [Pseudomonas aeruginosa]|nr:DNA repair protein [Pseudomonas aeruginosa]OPE23451.1 DNA repair protein [Pseudomonas aeruginosa]RQJ37190.1 DNA repair protein [Pseudomonas aeruginosa]RTW08461.1 DNA repair protein [Pseudomonas aeruginosa]RTW17084.1 DNA repair protein [Pseudomonas aeruginosa]
MNQHGGRLRGFYLVIYTVFFPAGNCRSPLEPWKAVPI